MTEALLGLFAVRELGIYERSEVMDVKCFPIKKNSAYLRAATDAPYLGRGETPVISSESNDIVIGTKNLRVVSVTQPRGILGDSVQHWLNIRWRAGDDTQDFAGCSLLLQ
jgi:hypothetical protein